MKPKTSNQLSIYQDTNLQLKLIVDNFSGKSASGRFSLPSSNDPISSLSLPIRIENALKIHGRIKTVGELFQKSERDILKIRNIGTGFLSTFNEIKKSLIEAGFIYDPPEEINSSDKEQTNLRHSKEPNSNIKVRYEYIKLLLEKCILIRDKEVVIRRYGLKGGESQTLEEIGAHFGVTRERIRQIQKRSILRMKKLIPSVMFSLKDELNNCFYNSGGFITEEEADTMIPKLVNSESEDGSASLELFCDLGIIQRAKFGDITIYSPLFNGVSLEQITDKLRDIIKDENVGISLSEIKSKIRIFGKITDPRFDRDYFILKYCWVDPRIEEVAQEFTDRNSELYFRHYTSGNFPSKGWIARMIKILETEGTPLHFTEITNKLNDLIKENGRKIEVRRAHSILIESKAFAHVGVRGTYGLTSWGLRKESVPELIEECLIKAGFPVHLKQIFQYVGRYKETKQGNLVSILESNPRFIKIKSGIYGLKNT